MKTLDDVIEAIEACRDSYVAGKIIKADALHYLKAFRDSKNALDAEREKAIEAYCQWKDAKEKLEAQTSQMMWVDKHFQFEISDNPPLTWDELKQMEGKPVWVEALLYKQWAVIAYVGSDHIRFEGANLYAPESREYMGADNGWQAYRKERN